MGLFALHQLLFDLRSHPDVHIEYRRDRETVYERYSLSEDELAPLRTDDIYRLHKLGVATYLLASYAEFLGFPLQELADILRAGADAEHHESTEEGGV